MARRVLSMIRFRETGHDPDEGHLRVYVTTLGLQASPTTGMPFFVPIQSGLVGPPKNKMGFVRAYLEALQFAS